MAYNGDKPTGQEMGNDRLPVKPEMEQLVLGAVLVDNAALPVIEQHLSPADFFYPANSHIFAGMQKMAAAGQTIEPMGLHEALGEDPAVALAGGMGYIVKLDAGIYKMCPVAQWAQILAGASTLRRAAHVGRAITESALAKEAEADEVLQQAQALVAGLGAPFGGQVLGVLASEVEAESVAWLWRGRIPLGKVTTLDGDPGLGKSAVTLDIAARVSTGRSMPDGSPGIDGGVLVLSAEDGTADTIVPRLAAMGANLDRVKILKTIPTPEGERQPAIPGDLAAIERAASSVRAKLIIIDPLTAYLSRETNSWRDQDVRRALAPLAAMAERIGAAILLVRHLNKGESANALYRGGGSIGIIGAARSGLLAAPDPEDETGESRILGVLKANLAVVPLSLRYRVQPEGAAIGISWEGPSGHRAAALLSQSVGEDARTAVEEAAEFLESFLMDNPATAEEVRRKARAAGFADRTLDRAKKRLRIKPRHEGFGKGSTWVWELPAKSVTDAAKVANCPNLAIFEQGTDSKPIESMGSSKDATPGGLALFSTDVASYPD